MVIKIKQISIKLNHSGNLVINASKGKILASSI
jgi:hypothetical protein